MSNPVRYLECSLRVPYSGTMISPTDSVTRIIRLILLGSILIAEVAFVSPRFFTLPEERPGCDVPLKWKLGDVDSRFPVDRRTFLRTVFEAETVWENRLGKRLFEYDPQSDFVVTTEFDERQIMTYDSRKLKESIARYEDVSEDLKARYERLRTAFTRDSSELTARIDTFQKTLAAYNADVAEANRSGGASPDEYDSLEKRRKAIEKERDAIEKESARIDAVAAEVNAAAADFNAKTSDIQGDVAEYREKYGTPEPFIEGLYDPEERSITIYQFETVQDLRLVLAHELGHALGIDDHVSDDPQAIMYPMMGGQDTTHPAPTYGDIAALEAVCPPRTETLRDRVVRYLVTSPAADIRLTSFLALFRAK